MCASCRTLTLITPALCLNAALHTHCSTQEYVQSLEGFVALGHTATWWPAPNAPTSLHLAALCCTALHCICAALHFAALHCICAALQCVCAAQQMHTLHPVLCCILGWWHFLRPWCSNKTKSLHCPILHCTALHCTALYSTPLHCALCLKLATLARFSLLTHIIPFGKPHGIIKGIWNYQGYMELPRVHGISKVDGIYKVDDISKVGGLFKVDGIKKCLDGPVSKQGASISQLYGCSRQCGRLVGAQCSMGFGPNPLINGLIQHTLKLDIFFFIEKFTVIHFDQMKLFPVHHKSRWCFNNKKI